MREERMTTEAELKATGESALLFTQLKTDIIAARLLKLPGNSNTHPHLSQGVD